MITIGTWRAITIFIIVIIYLVIVIYLFFS